MSILSVASQPKKASTDNQYVFPATALSISSKPLTPKDSVIVPYILNFKAKSASISVEMVYLSGTYTAATMVILPTGTAVPLCVLFKSITAAKMGVIQLSRSVPISGPLCNSLYPLSKRQTKTMKEYLFLEFLLQSVILQK